MKNIFLDTHQVLPRTLPTSKAVVLMPHLGNLWEDSGYYRLVLTDDLCAPARENRNLRNSWASPCGSGPAGYASRNSRWMRSPSTSTILKLLSSRRSLAIAQRETKPTPSPASTADLMASVDRVPSHAQRIGFDALPRQRHLDHPAGAATALAHEQRSSGNLRTWWTLVRPTRARPLRSRPVRLRETALSLRRGFVPALNQA